MVMPWGQRGCTNGHCLFYYSKLKRAVLRVDKANHRVGQRGWFVSDRRVAGEGGSRQWGE